MASRATRTGIALAWVGFTLATQRWLSLDDGIRQLFASDARSYRAIAAAAPSLPGQDLPLQHAERFPAHWVVGVVGDATGIGLDTLYRALSLLCLAAIACVVAATLAALRLSPLGFAVAFGAFVASAYPVHYLLASPGMLADAVFLLGAAVALLGFVRGRFGLVLGGLVLGVLGRQTAVPVAVAAAAWVAVAPAWRGRRPLAAVTLLVPLLLYGIVHLIASSFALRAEGIRTMTALGASPRQLPEHVARLALGILVPSALVLGAWLRTRSALPVAALPLGALAFAVAVVLQPLLLAPTWTQNNDPRLAALAAPALVVAAGALIGAARLGRGETAVLCLAIAVASLHDRFTDVGLGRELWVALTVLGALTALGVLARRREPRPVTLDPETPLPAAPLRR